MQKGFGAPKRERSRVEARNIPHDILKGGRQNRAIEIHKEEGEPGHRVGSTGRLHHHQEKQGGGGRSGGESTGDSSSAYASVEGVREKAERETHRRALKGKGSEKAGETIATKRNAVVTEASSCTVHKRRLYY